MTNPIIYLLKTTNRPDFDNIDHDTLWHSFYMKEVVVVHCIDLLSKVR